MRVRRRWVLAEDADGLVRPVDTDRGQTLVWVMVRYTASGFAASDRAVPDGPGYQLGRETPDRLWRIVDSGTP